MSAKVVGPKSVEGRTPVVVTFELGNLGEADRQHFFYMLVDGFERDDTQKTVSVTIHVGDADAMVQAMEWRKACIGKIHDQAHNVSVRGANAWYHLVQLKDFPLLKDFARDLESLRKCGVHDTPRHSGEVDEDDE